MDCAGFRDDMMDVLYGEADAEVSARFEAHRLACGECRQELASLEESRELAKVPPDELRIDLVNAIESLSPSHREVLLLRDLEDLTIWEIAGRLGVTREAAKSRLRRARTLVREYLLGTKDSGREST